MVKFLHLADLHLDTPFVGLGQYNKQLQERLLQASKEALQRGISIAIKQEVDFVLMVGDLYDTHRQTVSSQNFFMQEVKRLEEAGIPLVLSYGNHDYQSPNQALKKYSDHVYVFEGENVGQFEFESKNGEKILVYGFSYQHQWIEDSMVEQFPNKADNQTVVIGMYHGQAQTNLKENNRYAPFKVSDLIDKGYDYWALGHIHQAQVLSQQPLIQYPGSIQAKSRKEIGDKGGYLVEIKDERVTSQFISLASIRFERAQLDAKFDWDDMDFLAEVRQILRNYQEESLVNRQAYLVEIRVEEGQRLSEDLVEKISSGQFTQLVNEEYDETMPVQLLSFDLRVSPQDKSLYFSTDMKEAYEVSLSQLEDSHYLGQVLMAGHGSLVKQMLRELVNDPDERQEVKNEAILLFTSRLGLQNGGDNLED